MQAATTQASPKKRPTFWLIDRVGPSHRAYALELSKRGFDVQFFATLDALVQESRMRRPAVIVVGDEGSDQLVEKAILTLTSMPDLLGARLVMSLSRQHENLKRFAACGAFRDLIPLDLDPPQWVSRFLFATASNDSKTQAPAVQVTMNSIAAVSVPARIVWISKSRMWLECRVRPHRGAIINLTGPLAEALGVASLPLSVEETRANNLTYRFSDAVVASWRVPDLLQPAVDKLLEELAQIDSGPRCKVFVAIQDADARSEVLRQLDVLQFEVTTALHKMSVVEEPRFFSPHLVFIEDSLCIGENQVRFRKMLANLNPGVPVVIVGNKLSTEQLQNLDLNRRMSVLPRVTPNLTQLIWKKFLPKTSRNFADHGHDGAIYMASDHLFSVALVNFSSRLTKLHPANLQLSLPFPIGQYGLFQIDSPLLRKMVRRNPYAKVTQINALSATETSDFRFSASCTFSDIDLSEQKKIANGLVKLVSEQLLSARPVNQDTKAENAPAAAKTANNVVAISPNTWQSSTWTVPTHPQASAAEQVAVVASNDDRTTSVTPERSAPMLRRVKAKSDPNNMRYFLGFVLFTGAFLAAMVGITNLLSPKWQRSGSQYSESLKKMNERYKSEKPSH